MLYKWQEECLKQIEEKNAIISAPTGAGKTKVAYVWMDIKNAVKGNHRIFYTVPIKALANEKYRELQEVYGEEHTGIETGDVKVNTDAPLLVCTQEVYTRKYARRNIKAKVVIDEFHYIFKDPSRARAYIDGIRFSKHNILVMSATFGNPEEVKTYLNRISDKEFILYHTDFRPTKIEFLEDYHKPENVPPNTLIYLFNIKAIDYLTNIIASFKQPLPLLKRRRIKKLANSFKVDLGKFPELSKGIARYHSRLKYTEKKFIEEAVKLGYVNIILSTDALGVGVNLPIENVLFASFQVPNGFKSTRTLTKTEFIQLSGRAGRKGFFETGYVGVLLHSLTRYETPYEILSTFKIIKEKEIEPPKVELHPDIEKLVMVVISIDDEINYISEYSYPKRNREEVEEELKEIEKEIEKNKDVLPYMKEFFFPEMSVNENAYVIRHILETKPETTKIIDIGNGNKIKEKEINIHAESLPIQSRDEIATLLLKRKVAKALNGRRINDCTIKIRGIHDIENKIRNMDPLLIIG